MGKEKKHKLYSILASDGNFTGLVRFYSQHHNSSIDYIWNIVYKKSDASKFVSQEFAKQTIDKIKNAYTFKTIQVVEEEKLKNIKLKKGKFKKE